MASRTTIFSRSKLVMAAATAALMLAAACSGASSGKSERAEDTGEQDQTVNGTLPDDGPAEDGGIFRVNQASDAPTIDPHKSASFSVPAAVTGTVYSKLVEFTTEPRDLPYAAR